MSNKAIGQFFSGRLVSNLLVLSTELDNVNTLKAIDPMAGRADMLDALKQAGAHEDNLYGIDIDSGAVRIAESILTGSHFLAADAFEVSSVDLYNAHSWDLVITNPPYVRYQSLDALYGENAVDTVRNNLIATIEALDIEGSKEPYLACAKKYSGLADLAIPCWILCACLVRPGGKLAMVLPDSWLKREYASSVRNMLKEEYSIDRIIVDESRSWFDDAQVKTNLLIATKNNNESVCTSSSHVHHIGIMKRAATPNSLVGNLTYDGKSGKEAFSGLCRARTDYADEMVWARYEDIAANTQIGRSLNQPCAATLYDWGFSVGQGLRTGANSFFYFEDDGAGFATNEIWETCVGNTPVDVQDLPLIPAFRYQNEIGASYTIPNDKAKYHLLCITKPLDMSDLSNSSEQTTKLKRYIKYCEEHDVTTGGRRQRIPCLSAVRTNGPTSKTPECTRYWYMLPALKSRHLPNLLIPRINGGPVQTYLLSNGCHTVVDANFSTLWINDKDQTEKYVGLALLNSTCARLELERTCTVFGGGALKCEAVSLRKMQLPQPTERLRNGLHQLGMQLANVSSIEEGESIRNRIDWIIACELAENGSAEVLLRQWTDELNLRLKLRMGEK